MKRFSNILVATDTRCDSHPILDEAAKIAQENEATLKIVDVVPHLQWTARLTLKKHEDVRKAVATDKQAKLNELAARLRDQGINVESKVLWGKTSAEIVREVLRSQHDLVMRVAKGHRSSRKGFFGATSRQLLRDCPCAVWLATAAENPGYSHVLACIDTSTQHGRETELSNRVFNLASAVTEQQDAEMSVLHAWSMDAGGIPKSRISPIQLQDMKESRRGHVEGLLDEFLKEHGTSIQADNVHLIKDDPVLAIPAFTKEHGVDLVVIGTMARSGLSGIVIGNTVEQILDDLECSVLAVKRGSFVSSIIHSERENHTDKMLSS